MKLPKATMRKSGKRMMTVQVAFHIGEYEMRAVIKNLLLNDEPVSKSKAIAEAKRLFEMYGEGMVYREERDTSKDDEVDSLITELFPELL